MTKIAVASEEQIVTDHFGHCINFNIYDAEDYLAGKLKSTGSVCDHDHE